jgi:hypothetical protein
MRAKRRGSRSRKCGAVGGEGAREASGEDAPARERVAAVVWKSSPPTLRVTTDVDAMAGGGEFCVEVVLTSSGILAAARLGKKGGRGNTISFGPKNINRLDTRPAKESGFVLHSF